MALGDISVKSPGGNNLPSAWTFPVAAAATTINAGEPCKLSSTFAIPAADADCTTAAPILGIATSTSTQTSAVAGTVDVQLPTPGMVFTGKAKSAASVDTAAELQAVIGLACVFDLTSSTYTVDVASTGASDGLYIVGGDITTGDVYFTIRPTCLQQN